MPGGGKEGSQTYLLAILQAADDGILDAKYKANYHSTCVRLTRTLRESAPQGGGHARTTNMLGPARLLKCKLAVFAVLVRRK